MKSFQQQLRANQTDAEKLLWYYLKNKQFLGLKFRRQASIGNYIVDFVCFERKIIIELDGSQHNDNDIKLKDNDRSYWLSDQGFMI